MKAREQGGVVDERLNVYGVQSLKIAGKYYYYYYFLFLRNLILTLILQTAASHQAM